MRGKLIGYEKWVSKKGEPWVNVYFAVDKPNSDSVGIIVDKYMCLPSVIPNLNKDFVGKTYLISTKNNFLNEIDLVKE